MAPYYTIMKLPGEQRAEFIQMLPFTPRRRDNLASWMVARSDGDKYGQLMVFEFPKQKLVFGPHQVVARINQDQVIAPQITLWNQQGSRGDPGHADGDSDRGVADLRAAAVPARAGRPHPRADARDRRVSELDRDGAHARCRARPAVLARGGRRAQGAAEGHGVRARRGGEPARCGAGRRSGRGRRRCPGGDPRRRRALPPAIAALPPAQLTAEAQATYQRAIAAQRAGDWAAYGAEITRLGQILERLAAPR